MNTTHIRIVGAIVLAASLSAATGWAGDQAEKAPMPQTKGMQGMDPALHDQWEKEGKQDPYHDCKPNEKAAARQAKHPMPQTKGMQGMDPKAHEVDCPEAVIQKSDQPKHVHKAPAG